MSVYALKIGHYCEHWYRRAYHLRFHAVNY